MLRDHRVTVLALVVALALTALPAGASFAKEPDAGAFLKALSDEAFAKLSDPALSEVDKERNFSGLFRSAFDVPAISRFVLGRYWQRASAEQQEAFMQAFEEMHMRRFLPMFAEHSNNAIRVENVNQDTRNDSLYLVTSEIRRAKGEPIAVVWRIHDDGDSYKVLDIVAEGVSMAISLRQEYGAVAKRHGIDGLIGLMREKNAELAAQ